MQLDQFRTRLEAIAYLKAEKGIKTEKEAEKYLYAHLPKEKEYQRKIIKYIAEAHPDAFVWKAAAGPYTRGGIPDICAVINGKFFGFEVKRPYVGKLTAIQRQTIKKIRLAGGAAGAVSFPADVERMIAKERE